MKPFLGSIILLLASGILGSALLTHRKPPNLSKHRSNKHVELLDLAKNPVSTKLARSGKKGPKNRKLMLPMIIKLLKAMQKAWEVHLHGTSTFNEISGGKTSIVLPRDAPTVVVNRMPLQGFKLNANQEPNPDVQKNIYYRILSEQRLENDENLPII
jgi:hypothetical protein